MHKRTLIRLALAAVLLLVSCQVLTPSGLQPAPNLPPTTAAITSAPPLPPTYTPLPSPAATNTQAPLPSLTPTQAPGSGFEVRAHPDGGLYAGDRVSFEVIAPPEADLEGARVSIYIDEPEGDEVGTAEFGRFGIQGRRQATLYWVWNTAGLEPGEYPLRFTIEPNGSTWTETFTLLPEGDLPPPEPYAQWAQTTTECCIIHYITGTDAERDLAALAEAADQQARLAMQRIGGEFTEPLVVTLLPRVLGHGGFASNEMSVSYLDRNYAGSRFELVLHHEMIHILDMRLGGELRPSLLVEGLAVYLTGGHFKLEPLLPRAAALLQLPATMGNPDLGWYLPLQELADDFYASQHEIGYLQAAALVEYLVETYGWQAFSDFYRDIQPHASGSQGEAIQDALVRHFELTLLVLEEQFLAALRQVEVTQDHIDDVRLTVEYYDTVLRYQRLLDPSAYFRTAWLLYNEEMRSQGIVADYVRHPSEPVNICLESLLVEANQHLVDGRLENASQFLETINLTLDEIEFDAQAVPALPAGAVNAYPGCQVWTNQ